MFTKSQLALVIGAMFTAPSVVAQNVETDEHMIVEGRDYGYKADSNAIAMRMEMSQLETPGQIAVLDQQIIEEQRASTLGEVLKNDASVTAGGTDRNRERFSLRGFEVDSGSGFLRDGHQHWSHYRQPVELLERVEVVKGPSGLLYGVSAPGGLINMVSKKPTYDTQVNVSQDIGSNDRSRSMVDVSGALNDDQTLRARTVVSKESYSSWRTYGDGSKPQTERLVAGVFIDYDISQDVTLSFHYDKTNDNGSVDSGALCTLDGERIGSKEQIWDAQWSNIENNVQNIGFNVNANLSSAWYLNTGFNYQDFERNDVESYPDFSNYDSNGTVEHGGNNRHDQWRYRTGYVDFVGNLQLAGMDHQLLVGSNWLGYSYDRNQKGFNSQNVAPGESVDVPTYSGKDTISHSSYDTWGFYAQDLITLNESWQLLAGLRFDRKVSDGVAEENVSPKLAVIYHPATNGSIYASYSESFEPQGVVASGSRTYTNDGELLDAALGKAYELGTKWELLDDRLFVSGAVFDITKDNINMDVEEPSSGNWTKTQGGKQVHRGAELAAQGYLSHQLSLTGSAMYLDAEIENHETYAGNRPVDVPEFAASVWTSYAASDAVDVNLGVIYEGARYGDDANTFKKDAYTRVDMGVAYTYKYDQNLDMIARLTVENLFDTEYLAGGGATSSKHGYAEDVVIGEGRNYMATLQIRY